MHARLVTLKRYVTTDRFGFIILTYTPQLRCTREQGGCCRCLSRNLDCKYERDSQQRSRSYGWVNRSTASGHASVITPVSDDADWLEDPAVIAHLGLDTISSSDSSIDSSIVVDFHNNNIDDVLHGFSIPRSSAAGSPNDLAFSAQAANRDNGREGWL